MEIILLFYYYYFSPPFIYFKKYFRLSILPQNYCKKLSQASISIFVSISGNNFLWGSFQRHLVAIITTVNNSDFITEHFISNFKSCRHFDKMVKFPFKWFRTWVGSLKVLVWLLCGHTPKNLFGAFFVEPQSKMKALNWLLPLMSNSIVFFTLLHHIYLLTFSSTETSYKNTKINIPKTYTTPR